MTVGSPLQKFRCILHGSFRKHFAEIKRVRSLFANAGIEVLAPQIGEIRSFEDEFAILEGDTETDARLIELVYLHNLKGLGRSGFSYFVNPEGYIGKSASYELGIAQTTNVRCFFMEQLADHPAYVPQNTVWSPERLIEFIQERGELPKPGMYPNERKIHHLWEDMMVPGSVVAVGGIIEHQSNNSRREKEILLVKTHKWGGRYSIIGGKVRRNEGLEDGLRREVLEETGLQSGIGEHICTFDQIKDSGYYAPGIQHIFIDKVVHVGNKHVRLNDEAQGFVWMTARAALRDLDIEPNARHTVELYANQFA